ncbi:hypothetical protein [Saccharothrix yanglingensis]|uniref:hypothetical protein n=1 Tax=Saccharothrix yanglingensis TaxID=659496 RepID=UPI0027D201FA|nr:hypothetical protein [Saccharothrix yanglingensis]
MLQQRERAERRYVRDRPATGDEQQVRDVDQLVVGERGVGPDQPGQQVVGRLRPLGGSTRA